MPFSLTERVSVNQLMDSLIPATSNVFYQNPALKGDPRCAALFSGALSVLTDNNNNTVDFPDNGFLLGTGDANVLYGQNGTESSKSFGTPGDPDIAVVNTNRESYDACTLSFDFKCKDDMHGYMQAFYAFASDEWIEQVQENTGYSDNFALLLNGENIALVPGTNNTAVTVYTINESVNSQFFNYNNPRMGQSQYEDFEPDGFTKILEADGPIIPGWNKMKIGIVDIQDTHYDSWVFLQAGTFICMPALTELTDDGPIPNDDIARGLDDTFGVIGDDDDTTTQPPIITDDPGGGGGGGE